MRLEGDPHDISLIKVREETCEDDGGILIFQDPDGNFHKVYGLPPSLENIQEDGWRLIAAVESSIEGRERDIYIAATRAQIGDVLWK